MKHELSEENYVSLLNIFLRYMHMFYKILKVFSKQDIHLNQVKNFDQLDCPWWIYKCLRAIAAGNVSSVIWSHFPFPGVEGNQQYLSQHFPPIIIFLFLTGDWDDLSTAH